LWSTSFICWIAVLSKSSISMNSNKRLYRAKKSKKWNLITVCLLKKSERDDKERQNSLKKKSPFFITHVLYRIPMNQIHSTRLYIGVYNTSIFFVIKIE
jgi:hypothetical protein